MSYKYPYVLSSIQLTKLIQQFRNSLPSVVTADTLKKLGIEKNESYILTTLKFIRVIDNDGNKTQNAANIFSKHEEAEFYQEFSELVRSAYSELFDMHKDQSWTLDKDKLISFFRGSDHSSEKVGRLQANTFQVLAAFSGHGEFPKVQKSKTSKKASPKPQLPSEKEKTQEQSEMIESKSEKRIDNEKKLTELGLTIRIEINLPAVADQNTYDMIFKSIRDNLINA